MDVQDHKKNASSEQEIHSVYLCHKCGWPFPNPHPSAKHRRAHKRVCGTVEGYKLIDSGSDHSNLAGSDSEHISDDDRRIPICGVGGGGPREVFHVLEDPHVSKDEKTAGMSQPPHGLTELQQGSTMVGEMSDNAVMRAETNQSETTMSTSDTGSAKVLDPVSSRPCLESNSSQAVSELIVVSDSFHDTSEIIVISDNSKTDCETGKQSSSLGPYIRDNEKVDQANEDVHCTTTNEVLQSEHKLEIAQKLEAIGGITSGPLELEATKTEIENETLDPQVQYDSQFKLNNVNVETSHARIVGEPANQEVLANDLQFKHDASSRTKHQELRDALSVSKVESDSPKHLVHCSPGQSNELCDVMEAGNESTPFLSPAETFPPEENAPDMIGDLKDYEMSKSGASLDLRAAEEDRSPENDKKTPILEIFQDALSNLPDGLVDWSCLNPLESKVEKQHVSTPESGASFISDSQNLPSTTVNAFAGTIDELKEKCVSTTIDGEVGTVVPDLPSAHAETVAFTSEKVSNLQNIQNAVSNVSARSVDNSSSDAFNGDLDKAAVSTPIDGQTGMAVPENLSSVPCGTEDNSSLDALQDDLKKVGTSSFIGADGGGTTVTANIICPSSSMSTGTSGEFLLDPLKYDLKKEDVSTSISVEFIPPVPALASEESKMPAGTLENITSEGMDDELKKNSVSAPINGDADTSLWGNLPSANSSVIVGAVDNSASEPLDDDLRKEVISTPDGGEAGASVHEELKNSLSNALVVGSADNILSEALEDNHEEEAVSTLHDGSVDTSVPDNLPCVLSSVPSGTKDNSCEQSSEDSLLNEEGVLTPDGMEIGSTGFRVTSDEDNHLLLSAETLPSVENPEAMMGDLENYKVLKSSFSLDVGADEDIKLVEDDKKVNVFECPVAFKDVPAENMDNSLSGNLEDDFKKEGVSIPIHGEVGAFGFKGTSDEESHLLSAADTSPVVDNPEALIGEFKDYNVLKSGFSLDIGAAEEIISLENDKKVTAPENLPSAVSNVPSGNTDNSPSDALEDDLRKECVSIPIDGEIDASEFKFNSDVDLGDFLKAPSCETNNSEPNNNAEGSLNWSIDEKFVRNKGSEPASTQESDVVPLQSSTGEQPLQMVNLCGSGIANNHGDDKLVHVAAGNGNIQAGYERSDIDSTTLVRVETIQESTEKPVLLVGNHSLENSSIGFSSASDIQTVEVTAEERSGNHSRPTCESTQQLVRSDCSDKARNSHPLQSSTGEQTLQMVNLCGSGNANNHGDDKLVHVAAGNGNIQAGDEPSNIDSTTLVRVETIPETTEKPVLLVGNIGFSNASDIQTVEVTTEERSANHSRPTCESTQQLVKSDCSDEARNSHPLNVEAIASGKLFNSSESSRHTVEILHNSEGLKMGNKTEVSNSSSAPEIVSELKYEDPMQRSEQIHEGSCLKEVAAPTIESQNIRDRAVLGSLQDNVDENIMKPNLSILAVDNFIGSSGRTDSLEGNWGSVSVLSTQSDVGNFANAIDNQAAEKLDNEFKKQDGATMERHPHKSDDVFEPPSFMTLVESGVAVDKNATGSEMQTTETKEQSKSEALKAGWFPSITNVVNESEGRKKNEEIISKVTNWSTGKQHSPLKNLLNAAHVETKLKSSSSNVKHVPAVNNNQADETASASKNNGIAVTTTVSSILGSKMQEPDAMKKEIEKEWNSPARYPIEMKKEKRKGKPYWVPFVCCTSVHQDL